ncbi:hypothetical protein HOV93_40550 [Planctomycetes bacterium FF15]|uniref:Uncharacterized protein n=1 Tax=Bremerella alba TaxID=980252 RepID=A0A7V8V8E1_9BACT|nr:hypothetical protein [Bremerella alba]
MALGLASKGNRGGYAGLPLILTLFPWGSGGQKKEGLGVLIYCHSSLENRARNKHLSLPMERFPGFPRLSILPESWLEAANPGELMGFNHRF